MRLRFTKMQGAGNDFVVVDALRTPFQASPERLRWLADRRYGVGADQILVVEPAPGPGFDFGYRIYNADGGEVEQCGNGARCLVRFLHDQRLTDRRELRIATRAGPIVPRLEDDGEVTVDMGPPRFEPAQVPFDPAGLQAARVGAAEVWPLALDGVQVPVTVVSMGNPHAVLEVDDVDAAPVAATGPRIEVHPRFPQRVNAGFLQVLDRRRVRLRVWERGAGETLACGTGACAAVVVGIRRGLLDPEVEVQARGGRLRIRWAGDGQPVWMTGPAVRVFDGEVEW